MIKDIRKAVKELKKHAVPLGTQIVILPKIYKKRKKEVAELVKRYNDAGIKVTVMFSGMIKYPTSFDDKPFKVKNCEGPIAV